MKAGVRYIAIASGPIKSRKKALLIGIVLRDNYIEGLLSSKVQADGTDSTRRIIRMIEDSHFGNQVRILILNGIALAGLNVVNPKTIERRLKLRIVLVNRRKQNANKLIKALRTFSRINKTDVTERVKIVKEYAKTRPLYVRGLFIQSSLEPYYVRKFSNKAFEAIRVAHIIARGIASGESKGRI